MFVSLGGIFFLPTVELWRVWFHGDMLFSNQHVKQLPRSQKALSFLLKQVTFCSMKSTCLIVLQMNFYHQNVLFLVTGISIELLRYSRVSKQSARSNETYLNAFAQLTQLYLTIQNGYWKIRSLSVSSPSTSLSIRIYQVGKHDEAWMILKLIHDTNMRARGQPEKVFTVSTTPRPQGLEAFSEKARL